MAKKQTHMEEELRESELRFSNSFHYSPIGIAIVSMDGRWIKVNQALCDYVGYTAEEMMTKTLRDITYPDDINATADFRRRILSGEINTCQLEKRYRHKSGRIVWISLSTSLVRDKAGEPLYFISQMEDITERKRIEQELQLHTTKLEETVELRTQELFAANQELTAMNEELTAMNEEVSAMNESLQEANRLLGEEIDFRQQKEQELLLRGKQYQATTDLLTHPGEDFDGLIKIILQDTLNLIGAPGGSVGLQDEHGKNFIVRYAVGYAPDKLLPPRPIDLGILGEVFRTGEMLLIEDYRQYAPRLNDVNLAHSTTVIMAPLMIDGKVEGVLTANWRDEVHRVTDEDREVLRQFGILASIALEKFHAKKQITYQKDLLQRLAETTATLVNELDLDKTLQNILEQATAFMNIPHGFISFFEPDGYHATIRFGLGRYANRIGTSTFFNGKGIYAEVLRTGKIVIVDDYANWPKRLAGSFTDTMTASMQAPLTVNGEIFGCLGLSVFDEPFTVDQTKLAVFEQLAAVATIAVKNAMTHQKTHHQALHDTLTDLPNRAFLNSRLDEEMQKARNGEANGAVFYIDLDDLKTVNDSFGHSCGDGVIKAAASQIADIVGPEAFVARVGGDEFIVILSGEDRLKNIAQIANRIVSASHREYEVGGRNIHMSASVGVTLYPGDGNVTEEILKNADSAMYAAKAAGRSCWRFFEPEMLKDAYGKWSLTQSLRHALERGELYLHFQPQIALKDYKVIGFEALLRWNSPEHGMVPPARFIHLAENSGLILPIGNWVIEEACRFARKLAEIGREGIRIAVNISPRQLASEGFVEMVRLTMEGTGVQPKQLEVEITENVLIDSLEDSIQKLGELKAMGVCLSLDDFGTGFSSLTYLRNLPVETLKIDKSFVDKILADTVQNDFVRSIIDMAHAIGLQVTAEGVESEVQLEILAQYGCDCVQGYIFSKPVSPEEALLFSSRKAEN
jgi:diguanylate cyclase (GGDEF)-like protein/PAS domain S-box-containing protein